MTTSNACPGSSTAYLVLERYSDVFWAHDCVGLRGERLCASQQAEPRMR